ncbi:MAG TPA: hypothetical protein VF698_07850 [Thermoanaerobaculia bacterium]
MSAKPPLKLIWFAMLAAVAIYVVLAWTTIREPAGISVVQALEIQPVPILYLLALVMLLAAMFLPRLLHPGMRLIIRWALLEAVVIFGLIAAFIVREPRLVLPPAVMALAGFLTSFPSDETNYA